MRPLSLPKFRLLTKTWEYKKVYGQGKRLKGDQFTIIYTPNGRDENRLGVSVHGVKTAVKRNRIKRIIREFYRHNSLFIPLSVDIVFAVRNGFKPDSPTEVGQAVSKIIAKK
ncbi:MAG: ribonuclease P protein component [Proteobacteria bacterium]|nr:ribonuclease P protein component [Pseudomonadota bacterium]MBU1714185.1 ribonuclease P protein component [Pseudomonadota bacterium]